jgi:hypothetical protein
MDECYNLFIFATKTMKNIIFILLAIAIFSCSSNSKKDNSTSNNDSSQAIIPPNDSLLAEYAKTIFQNFETKNYRALAEWFYKDGVRFSAYAFIDTTNDIVINASEIKTATASTEVFNWGSFDGSGDPIEMTMSDYFADFVTDANFAISGEIAVNTVSQRGTTTNNIEEAYPDCDVVDLFIKGENPDFDGLDWKALRFVFKTVEGKTWLVGVIHDEWTI